MLPINNDNKNQVDPMFGSREKGFFSILSIILKEKFLFNIESMIPPDISKNKYGMISDLNLEVTKF